MISLKLKDGDLVFDNLNGLELVDEDEELAQSFKLLLEINLKEWFLNRDRGLDYNELQKKQYDKDTIRMALVECLTQDSRYEELLSYDLDVKDRSANINFTARVNGKELSLSVNSEVN